MSSVDLDADSPVNLVSADEFPSGGTEDLPIHTKRCRLLALLGPGPHGRQRPI